MSNENKETPTQETQSVTIPTEFTQEQALGVLVQAVQIAQKKGAYTLDDSEQIAKAVRVFARTVEKAEAKSATPKTDSAKTEPGA